MEKRIGLKDEFTATDEQYVIDLEEVISIIESNMKNPNEDLLDKYFEQFKERAKNRYPFSIDNPDLFKLIE